MWVEIGGDWGVESSADNNKGTQGPVLDDTG